MLAFAGEFCLAMHFYLGCRRVPRFAPCRLHVPLLRSNLATPEPAAFFAVGAEVGARVGALVGAGVGACVGAQVMGPNSSWLHLLRMEQMTGFWFDLRVSAFATPCDVWDACKAHVCTLRTQSPKH